MEASVGSGVDSADLTAVKGLKIERSTTAERVTDGLRALIIRGDLRPGSALREGALVDALGVSRNTLREAFRLLSREGLVVHRMHHGVEVKRLTEADVHDIYRARLPLEITAIRQSAELPRERLRPLSQALDEAEAALEARDWKQVATSDLYFHQGLVELLESLRISGFFEGLLAELRLAFAIPADQEAFLAPFVSWNRKMCWMLERGKQADCAREMQAYLEQAEQTIRSFLASKATPP
ncbi:MAG: GntR family transcriptional regulator [Thermoleophilaceae bacterium]